MSGLDLTGDVGAESGGQRAQPAMRLAMRSTAAASALPPPSPAATGIRLSMRTARAGRAGAASRRKAAMATEARLRPGTPGQSTVSSPPSIASACTSSARSIDANSEQSGCSPSARGRPT
jgi:hypothetical protein